MAPKTKGSGPAAPGPTTNPSTTSNAQTVLEDSSTLSGVAAINKKKQKRRQKQAARHVAADDDDEQQFDTSQVENQQLRNGDLPQTHNLPDPDAGSYSYSGEENDYVYDPAFRAPDSAFSNGAVSHGKKKKKSKLTEPPTLADHAKQPSAPRPISEDALHSVSRNIKEGSIWDTNGPEERSRIKAFWLALSENERKNLVNIEKSHVLQKMKEQQKHSCSCTVCGRKRTAIEEELEVLLKDPRIWADPTTDPPSDRLPSSLTAEVLSKSRVQELPDDEGDDGDLADEEQDDDDYDSEEFDEDEDDDYISEGDDLPPNVTSDFFQFGNSLTVKADGILTVADDLLKNDGQKFIDMMEQLAERRMQREEDARYNASHYAAHPSVSPQHGHLGHAGHPPLDEEDYDDEEDEDYDDEEGDYDEEEDEMDTMTEDQRMEEGRRMFQIFAARMFEQRVVTAYREKVAWERQQALINEQEQDAAGPSEAKKAKIAEKKKRQRMAAKEAKAQKEAAKEEEKQRREAAAREAEEKKRGEQRMKQDEQRKKKEAERMALEEKKRMKDAEIQKKHEAERERQQEQERKQRELKAEEKRRRDEADRKKREERDAKENEAREKKAQDERREREAKAVTEKEVQEPKAKETQALKASQRPETTHATRSAPASAVLPPTAVALPPSVKTRNSHDSPLVKIATPALPKAPTPSRPKETPSQLTSNPHTPERTPQQKHSTPPRSIAQQSVQPPGPPPARQQQYHATSYTPHMSPMHSNPPPAAMYQPGIAAGNMPTMGLNGYPGMHSQMSQGMMHRMPPVSPMPGYQPQGAPHHFGQQTRLGLQNIPQNVGITSAQLQQQQQQRPRESFSEIGPNILSHQPSLPTSASNQHVFAAPRDMPPPAAPHSRQPSNHFEGLSLDTQSISSVPPLPIGRPAPIKRPTSDNKSQNRSQERPHSLSANSDIDDIANQLGSSALIDDLDEPLPSDISEIRRPSAAPGSMRPSASVIGSPFDSVQSPFSSFSAGGRAPGDSWNRAQTSHFGPPGMPPPLNQSHSSGWGSLGAAGAPHSGASSSGGWGSSVSASSQGHAAFALPTHHRAPGGNPRLVTVRMFAVQAYKTLVSQSSGVENSGYFDFSDLVRQTVESGRQMHLEPGIQLSEIRNILDTDGDTSNGGGKFRVQMSDMKLGQGGRTLVRWVPDQIPNEALFGQHHPFQQHQQSLPPPHGLGMMQGPFGGQRQSLGLGELGSPMAEPRLPNLGGLGRL